MQHDFHPIASFVIGDCEVPVPLNRVSWQFSVSLREETRQPADRRFTRRRVSISNQKC